MYKDLKLRSPLDRTGPGRTEPSSVSLLFCLGPVPVHLHSRDPPVGASPATGRTSALLQRVRGKSLNVTRGAGSGCTNRKFDSTQLPVKRSLHTNTAAERVTLTGRSEPSEPPGALQVHVRCRCCCVWYQSADCLLGEHLHQMFRPASFGSASA